MAKKSLKFDVKEISAEGTFEGMLSPYGNTDLTGDIVERGAYTKTLQEHGNTVPMLWQHKTDCPIGQLSLEDRADGLWCKGQLLMTIPEAQKAYLLLKARIIKGLSIGFETVKDAVESGVRHLKEIRLYEGSVVTFPANLGAMVTSIKHRGKEAKSDFNQTLQEIQLSQAGYQMRDALSAALSSVFWSGLKKDEIVAATQTIIEQFSAAYLEYVPAYCDMLSEYYGDPETWASKRALELKARELESKAGRTISAATKTTLSDAQEHMSQAHEHAKSANDLITALLDPEADDPEEDDTSEEKAAVPKTEPVAVEDHSAAVSLITEIRSLLSAA